MKAGEKIRTFALEFRCWHWGRRLMAIVSLPYVLLGIVGGRGIRVSMRGRRE